MFCVKCGASNPSDAKFCHACGRIVGELQQPLPPPQQTRSHPSLRTVLLVVAAGLIVILIGAALGSRNQSDSTPAPESTPAPAAPAVQADDPATIQMKTLLHLTVDTVKANCGNPQGESVSPVFLDGVAHDNLVLLYSSNAFQMAGVNFAKMKPADPYQFMGVTTGLQLQMGALIGEKRFHSVLESSGRDEIVTDLPCLVTPPGGSAVTP
jgi:hypothetical protein